MFVCFPSLGLAGMRLPVTCVILWLQLAFFGWRFPSSIFCRAGLVARYCLNLVFSWNFLFSLSMVIENLAGYSSLGWNP